MKNRPNDDIGQLEQNVKEEWEEVVESDTELLEGMEKDVLEDISARNTFNPTAWMTRIRKSLSRLAGNLSPLQRYAIGGGAVAAVLLGLLLGWFISPSTGNVHKVVFKLPASNAKSVNLAGDFSGYEPIEMKDEDGDGVWTIRLDLEEGKYEYYYLVNGKKTGRYPMADGVVRDWDDSKNGIRFIGKEQSDPSDKRDKSQSA